MPVPVIPGHDEIWINDDHTPERFQAMDSMEGNGLALFRWLLSTVMLLPEMPEAAREQEGSEKKTDSILAPWL